MGEVVAQRLIKNVKSEMDKAIRYYAILSALNDLGLTKRQVQLLAFTAIRGTITPIKARKEFVKMFGSSMNSVENLKGKLVKSGLLVKKGELYRVVKGTSLDFQKEIVLKISLKGGTSE